MPNTNKIPIVDVVTESYRFAFGQFAPILKTVAVPLLVLAVAQYFLGLMSLDAQLAALTGGAAQPFAATVLMVALAGTVVQSVIIGIVAAALHRMVLFGEPAPHLRWGSVERKFIVVSLIFGIALILPSLAIAFLAPDAQAPGAAGVVMLAGLAALTVLIVSVFLTMVFPMIVAEGRVDLGRSMALVSGNWWRIVGTYVLAGLPLVFVGIIVALALGEQLMPAGGIQTVADLQRSLQAQKDIAIPMAAFNFVLNVIVTAVGVGILSFSYKALNGQALSATLTETPPV